MSELITLDGHPLTGVTRDGIWRVTELSGWWDRPAPKRAGESRANGDGSYPTPVQYGNRLISITGRVMSKNHEYLHQAQSQLNALGLRGGAKLLVSGHGPAQWATVQPRGEATAEFMTDKYLRFQIPLEAIDPFKYGESYAVSGSSGSPASLFQRGTVPAWPVVTVNNASTGTGYTLSLNGKTVVVTKSLFSAQTHTIDFRTGILRQDGVVIRGGISTANFSPINPGLTQTMSTTAGNITVRYSDTYI